MSGRDDDHPGLYRDPAVYDILHTPGTAEELDGLERAAAAVVGPRAVGGSAAWLEPACGTARLLRLAASRGRRVAGFDLSAAMIGYARAAFRRRGLAGELVVSSMETFDAAVRTRPLVAVNTINTIRHLPSDAALRRHLAAVGRSLRPGGVYLVGLSTACYGVEGPTEDVWTGARGRCRVTQTVQFEPPEGPGGGDRRERVTSHLAIERPSGTVHATSSYTLRTYSLEQWHAAVGGSALRVAGVFDASGRPADAPPLGYRLYALASERG